MANQLVIVSGYPKSGNTWLTRLLADVLNSPSAGSHPSQDRKEIASEGWDRSGSYLVRKGHYRLDYNRLLLAQDDNPIPLSHTLIPERLTNERVIFITRDPRDIIVSACHHWIRRSRSEVINLVCNGGLAGLPSWDKYIEQWRGVKRVRWTSYEKLKRDPLSETVNLLDDLPYDKSRIKESVERQSFATRKQDIKKNGDDLYLGKDYNVSFLRKGLVGEYKSVLSQAEIDKIEHWLGDAMRELRYL